MPERTVLTAAAGRARLASMKHKIAPLREIPAGGNMRFIWNPPAPFKLEDVRLVELDGGHERNEPSFDLEIEMVQVGNIILARWSTRVPVCPVNVMISVSVANLGKTPRTCTVELDGLEL
jgi:hypothetical protein